MSHGKHQTEVDDDVGLPVLGCRVIRLKVQSLLLMQVSKVVLNRDSP